MKQYFLNNFTMKDYALLSGRSLSTFYRDFKLHTNMTPKQYLLNLKLEYAHNLLNKSDKSVSTISFEIGYENISHFIKAFKNKYNITPENTLFIDDNYENILASNKFNLNGIHYKSPSQLIKSLSSFNLEF